ncbi:group III truncated hemoglobin [Pontibacter indicus]|uniref:Hemoglobin n=1 Tax=Pontibacter indicus TaxID=1317125 RepID=A0A1R3XSW8_9BACT|nr:group III truncated hemoglobin [Pontibacter indicus]SIT94970.1 hemoglobin [Pontibacter indicus]
MKEDIKDEQDIKLLVDSFYAKVNEDDLLGPIFNGFAKVDWEHHLPIMYNFWSSVLLGTMAYKGQPFPKHMRLPIDRQHFARWVTLFCETADELFAGEKTAELKQKATSIAQVFQMKMGLLDIIGKEITT